MFLEDKDFLANLTVVVRAILANVIHFWIYNFGFWIFPILALPKSELNR
jgi:hypothetical protein